MKQLLIATLAILSLSANAADSRYVAIQRDVLVLAKILQAKLPPLAADGMCEVERQGTGWNFTFRVKADKSTAQDVQVILRSTSATASELRVQGVLVEGSLVGSKRSADPALSKEWTSRILKLLEEEPG